MPEVLSAVEAAAAQPNDFITTYRKHRFSPRNPRAQDIDAADIAHALSLMCRANGHFNRFFSVARHCINCCREGLARGENADILLMLLLHDACEAYISDVTRPVKTGLPDYREIEKNLQSVIWERFKLFPADSDLKVVGEIDDMMLKLEFAELAGETIDIETCAPVFPPDFSVRTFEEDEREFLALFDDITKESRGNENPVSEVV